MATPTLATLTLPGALGDIFVDVRAAGRAEARPAVVIVHGFKGFKDWGFFPPLAERLARAGFTAVSFNMSGSGVDAAGQATLPERFSRNTYGAELADLAAVIDALEEGRLGAVPPTALGLVGHSRGGGIAVLQTARDRRVRALVTWAAIADIGRWDSREREEWRARGYLDVVNARTGQVIPLSTAVLDEIDSRPPELDIQRAAAAVAVPWLIIHGTGDDSVPVEDAVWLHRASGRDSTKLVTIPGGNHGFGAGHPWAPPVDAPIHGVVDATAEWLAASLR
jgi:dienelactone hydrolase